MSGTSSAPSFPSSTSATERNVVEEKELTSLRSQLANKEEDKPSNSEQSASWTSASASATASTREDSPESSPSSPPSSGEPVDNVHESDADVAKEKSGVNESSGQIVSSQAVGASAAPNAHVQGDWQAIWSAPHSMYYFHNMRTGETTWANPLSPQEHESGAGASSTSSDRYDLEAAALAQGIDPALAHLDPSLLAGPSNPMGFTYSAKFNARTGAFARADARNPEHVSEYERMRRMSSFYFDVDQWQSEVEQRHVEEMETEEAGKKRKKPTKKDIEMFQERKRQKKLAKTAWLRT